MQLNVLLVLSESCDIRVLLHKLPYKFCFCQIENDSGSMTGKIGYQRQKWLLLIVVLLGICVIGKIYKLIEPQQKYEIIAKIHQTFKSMAARADGENIPFIKEPNFPSNIPTPISPNISKSHLKIFDSFRYEEEMKTRLFERDTCVLSLIHI